VVHAGPDGRYPGDDAEFVAFILATVESALAGRVGPATLAGWLADRRRQLAAGDLVYIAHQLDLLGRAPS